MNDDISFPDGGEHSRNEMPYQMARNWIAGTHLTHSVSDKWNLTEMLNRYLHIWMPVSAAVDTPIHVGHVEDLAIQHLCETYASLPAATRFSWILRGLSDTTRRYVTTRTTASSHQ